MSSSISSPFSASVSPSGRVDGHLTLPHRLKPVSGWRALRGQRGPGSRVSPAHPRARAPVSPGGAWLRVPAPLRSPTGASRSAPWARPSSTSCGPTRSPTASGCSTRCGWSWWPGPGSVWPAARQPTPYGWHWYVAWGRGAAAHLGVSLALRPRGGRGLGSPGGRGTRHWSPRLQGRSYGDWGPALSGAQPCRGTGPWAGRAQPPQRVLAWGEEALGGTACAAASQRGWGGLWGAGAPDGASW